MRYVTYSEVIRDYRKLMKQFGGAVLIRDVDSLEAALANPRATFDGKELYPSLVEKASILCFSIVKNHPFVDGNKRMGYAVMEKFLIFNGYEVDASVDEQEKIILQLADSKITREEFTGWLGDDLVERPTSA